MLLGIRALRSRSWPGGGQQRRQHDARAAGATVRAMLASKQLATIGSPLAKYVK
ncbi:MAG: hypothetical protein WBY94_08715 [Polyangiaceae bacterium]